MVETILTNEMIKAGEAFVRKLDEQRLNPSAAFWFYFPDNQQWKLVLVEPDVGIVGPKEIYRKIQRILVKYANEFPELSLDEIALLKSEAPIIALLRIAIQTGPGISGVRFKNNVINGNLIEDAYIYRMN